MSDDIERVRRAADRIVRVLDELALEGYVPAILQIAIMDAQVRCMRSFSPISTPAALRTISNVALEMAETEDEEQRRKLDEEN